MIKMITPNIALMQNTESYNKIDVHVLLRSYASAQNYPLSVLISHFSK